MFVVLCEIYLLPEFLIIKDYQLCNIEHGIRSVLYSNPVKINSIKSRQFDIQNSYRQYLNKFTKIHHRFPELNQSRKFLTTFFADLNFKNRTATNKFQFWYSISSNTFSCDAHQFCRWRHTYLIRGPCDTRYLKGREVSCIISWWIHFISRLLLFQNRDERKQSVFIIGKRDLFSRQEK